MKEVNQRLALLRKRMQELSIDTYLIPSSDAHISEYVADHWKSREWISGFTGSAGTVIVTANFAGLWVDSRYFIQAAKQIEGTEFKLFKLRTENTPDYPEWLLDNMDEKSKLGFDGSVLSFTLAQNLFDELSDIDVEFVYDYDVVGDIWEDRPSIPKDKIFVHDEKFAGLSINDKLKQLLYVMEDNDADAHVLSALDDIAWLYNIRGKDIDYNPVAIAYSIITREEAILFIDTDKLDDTSKKHLVDSAISIKHYSEFYKELETLSGYILLDDNKTNFKTAMILDRNNAIVVEGLSPVTEFKAIKNKTEIDGLNQAHIRDGVSMLRFQKWLFENVGKIEMDEYSIGEKVNEFRRLGENHLGESFETIVGYKENGAIVHYSANKETANKVEADGFLLIDSGGQYIDGTTDITRMYYLGKEASKDEKRDYTNILKGNIALTKAVFPEGTKGIQLDVLARQFIWQEGQNYLHGTGHGVGCCLNVHEGPQSIRMEENPITLKKGMVVTNEPGVYLEGKYGIRIEHCLLVTTAKTTDFGEYYTFEPLTLCPIDKTAIDFDLMSKSEIKWINAYHQLVYDKLSPNLNKEEKEYLKLKTITFEK